MVDTIPLFLEQNKKEVYYVSNRIKDINGRVYIVDGERLGNGGNAVVHKCIDYITGEEYAIKFQLSLQPKKIKRFLNEIKLLQEVEHDQLIKYYTHGECAGKYKLKKGPEKEKNIPFLIMTLANKTLKEFMFEQGNVDFPEYIAQFQGLAAALAELHKKAIHRDIKPENILVSGETWILSDFGLCKFLETEEEEDLTGEKENVGPKFWMSPEALNRTIGNKDEILKCSDVYQLCSVFWYIINKRHPSGILTKEDWVGPDHIFDVIYNSLSHDPNKRPYDGEKLFQELYEATLAG
ncbi:protein kinase [Paenibacillus sp. cl141a]|uniref:protein kinase domain-containing protein n=1 Tax=Paenibacillus sp. cl141a TaxID=1761877 RepID=UPI000B8744E4|nr:protein kinase [Paenibacillus sp. cl141a]